MSGHDAGIAALDHVMSGGGVYVPRAFVTVTDDIVAAYVLAQLWYWTKRTEPQRDGWFYKGREEIADEIGVSRRNWDTARARLRDLGVLEEERRGMPARLWLRLDVPEIASLLARNVPTSWCEAYQLLLSIT